MSVGYSDFIYLFFLISRFWPDPPIRKCLFRTQIYWSIDSWEDFLKKLSFLVFRSFTLKLLLVCWSLREIFFLERSFSFRIFFESPILFQYFFRVKRWLQGNSYLLLGITIWNDNRIFKRILNRFLVTHTTQTQISMY